MWTENEMSLCVPANDDDRTLGIMKLWNVKPLDLGRDIKNIGFKFGYRNQIGLILPIVYIYKYI